MINVPNDNRTLANLFSEPFKKILKRTSTSCRSKKYEQQDSRGTGDEVE